jgi:hypothetical protein
VLKNCRSCFLSYSIIGTFCWNTSHVWGSRKRDEERHILKVLKAFETSPGRNADIRSTHCATAIKCCPMFFDTSSQSHSQHPVFWCGRGENSARSDSLLFLLSVPDEVGHSQDQGPGLCKVECIVLYCSMRYTKWELQPLSERCQNSANST